MHIVSAREFRSNQGKFLNAAMNGQPVFLTSRYGKFRITPVNEDNDPTARICEGLNEVKKIISGEIPSKSALDFLDEL